MKTKKEIERLARIYENYNPNDSEIAQAESGGCYHGYKKGYTQCQEDMADISKVTRFEVIDENGRAYTEHYCKVELSYQDDGRTLKVFIKPLKQD